MPRTGQGPDSLLLVLLLPPLLLLLLLQHPPRSGASRGAAPVSPCPRGCACHLDSYGRFSSYSLTRVDCSSSRLRAFPATLPLTATHLSLADNRLGPTVSPGGAGYTTLLALNLSRNGVRHLLNGSFSRLRYLDALDLSHNAVERVDAGAFERAPLSAIDLSHNALSGDFDLCAFAPELPLIGLRSLSLDLSHNRIGALETKAAAGAADGGGGAGDGTLHIRSLDLAANALAEVPQTELLRRLPRLQYLKLDSNPIAQLRESAFVQLRDLTHLSLRRLAPDVHFSRFTFRGLDRTLQVLDLSDNCPARGTSMRVELGNLTALAELRLSVPDDRSLSLLPSALGLPVAGSWKCRQPLDAGGGGGATAGGGRGEGAGCVNVACYRLLARETL